MPKPGNRMRKVTWPVRALGWVLLAAIAVVAITLWANTLGKSDTDTATVPDLPSNSGPNTPLNPALPPPITADYQAALTSLDTTVAPAVLEVRLAETMVEVNAAQARLSTALEAEAIKLMSIVAPTTVSAAHERLQFGLYGIADEVRKLDASIGYSNTCGNREPPLTYVKNQITATLNPNDMRDTVNMFAAQQFSVGAFIVTDRLPDETTTRRASNGHIVTRGAERGAGKLEIVNELDQDVAVSITLTSPANPQIMIYVRAGQRANLTRIAGAYQVFSKHGTDWNARERGFTRGCTYEKFDRAFDEDVESTVELRKARKSETTDVPAY